MSSMESILMLLGRLAVCSFFLWTAFEKVKHWNAAADCMRKKKVPYVSYVLPTVIALQAVGGLLLLVGFYPRLGALLLLIYMVPHVYKIHDFWNVKEGDERTIEKLYFMKDVAIIGGLLVLLAIGGGHYGVTG